MKVLSSRQMKQVDQRAIEELGIPGVLLMENAGRSVCEKVIEITENEEKSVLVICGKGNNGGDGFVAARHLIENSVQTTVISLFRPENLSGDALLNHNILENFTEIIYFDDIPINKFKEIISLSDIVVDAVFGTGLNSEIHGFQLDVIESINEYAEGEIVSVDIPSGVNAETGDVMGSAVIADYTVTFHSPKIGHLLYPGADYCGEIMVYPIGIPEFLSEEVKEYNNYLITSHYAHISLPFRPEDGHKGTFGKVFNIAGSFTMTGAAYMCAMSSLLVGAGYTILAAPESVIPIVAAKASEIVYLPLNENNALDKSAESDVILIGPGLGTEEATVRFVSNFIQQVTNRGDKVIVDGDGLNCLAMQERVVLPLNSIITPHPKELSRLMKIPVEEILRNKLQSAKQAAAQFNTIVVLKGANTIIAEPNGNAYINTTGNTGLATAGSGDVLAGMIAGFVAQSIELRTAAILGVFLHGFAANIALEEINEYSLTAEKLMEYVPVAINRVLNID
ncbi:MAG: hypothetical protein A2Y25_02565 [Candidatus Melainabacteria bacterium GWF2_37_15]|nr:MAG: hypothetical protein A2Y25_02565 [Candidatus Melainabacteria bacterium GWF2_37_15]